MSTLAMTLKTFKVIEKNEHSKDEAYLWCFGIVIDKNTLASKNFVIKTKPDQGNLGGGFKEGASRSIPANVGTINATVQPIFGKFLAGGLIVLAWEEDSTPNSKVKQAYDDSVKIINNFILARISGFNTNNPTAAELSTLKSQITYAIKNRFKAAVHWYNPFSWDPDDYIAEKDMFETIDPATPLLRPIDWDFIGDDAKYKVSGEFRFTP